jgi:hypothetical protein
MAEFPYIVSTDGSTVTGIVAADFEFVQRELGEENTLHFNRDAQRASFIIPFTEGGYAEIEDDQQLILANEFINQIHPSFSFFSPSTATVRTLLRSGADIEGYISIDSGRHRIKIEKTGENQITISEVTE